MQQVSYSLTFNFSFFPETLQLKGRHSNKGFEPTFADFLPVVKLTASLQAGCNTQPCQWKKSRQLLWEDEGGWILLLPGLSYPIIYLFIILSPLSPPPFKNRSAWFNTILQCQARQITITSHAQELIKAVGDFDQPWSGVMNNLDTWRQHEAQKRQKILLQTKYYAIIDLV